MVSVKGYWKVQLFFLIILVVMVAVVYISHNVSGEGNSSRPIATS